MPLRKKVSKDFLKEVFAGRKHLIPRAQLRPIEMPKYDELSVVNLIVDIMKEKELAKFFPKQRTKADLPDRLFFFNVMNTSDHDYHATLLKHAHDLRFGAKNPQDNPTTIEINDQWVKELQASPFYSRYNIARFNKVNHGKTLMLLKKNSKRARSGFKRKKLNLAGSYQENKAKGGIIMAVHPKPSVIA